MPNESRLKNLSQLFANTRTRVIVLLTLAIVIIGLIVSWTLLRTHMEASELPRGPGIDPVPGILNPSAEYERLQREENRQRAEEALAKGGSAIPTVYRLDPSTDSVLSGGVGFSTLSRQELQLGLSTRSIIDAVLEMDCEPAAIQRALNMGVQVAELLATGCDLTSLRKAGVTAQQLKMLGVEAARLHAAGFTAHEMNKAGFSLEELRLAGFSEEDLIALIQDPERKARLAELLNQGATVLELKEAGFTAGELYEAGISAEELLAAGFSPEQLRNAGFTAKELKEAGLSLEDLVVAGYTIEDLLAAGFTPEELRASGILGGAELDRLFAEVTNPNVGQGLSISELRQAGLTPRELRAAGFTAEELKRAGLTAQDLIAAGFTPEELKRAGLTAQDLIAAGFTAEELKRAGLSAQDLIAAGFTAEELKRAGLSAQDLITAGFTPKELYNVGVRADVLKQAGFTADELQEAGYSVQQLLDAGFILPEQTAASGKPQAASQGLADRIRARRMSTPVGQEFGFDQAEQETAPETTLVPVIANMTEGDMALQEILRRQEQQFSQQQKEQMQRQMQQAFVQQANQLFGLWGGKQTLSYVEAPPPAQRTEAAQNVVAANITDRESLVKAGTVMFAVLDTSVNSDEPGPILATVIEEGPFKGAKLLGNLALNLESGTVTITFSTLVVAQEKKSVSINAYAIDPETARTGLASEVNRHYLLRYGALFAASFLSGYGQAIAQEGTKIETRPNESKYEVAKRTTQQQIAIGLGNVGQAWSQAIAKNIDKPPTVRVYAGTSIGVLFMNDVDSSS